MENKLIQRLGAYYYVNECGQMAAKYFMEYYDKKLKMVIACDIPVIATRGEN